MWVSASPSSHPPWARVLGQSEARGGRGVSASPSSRPVCDSVVVVAEVVIVKLCLFKLFENVLRTC